MLPLWKMLVIGNKYTYLIINDEYIKQNNTTQLDCHFLFQF